MIRNILRLGKIRLIATFTLICFVVLVFISGCEGVKCGIGTVYDSNTKIPLDSVSCVSNGEERIYTDSTGRFNLCGPFGGCLNGCPKVEIDFSKKGYRSQKVTTDFTRIYLERE
jgi:hypothetical protein